MSNPSPVVKYFKLIENITLEFSAGLINREAYNWSRPLLENPNLLKTSPRALFDMGARETSSWAANVKFEFWLSLVKSHDTYLTFNSLLSAFVSSSASDGQPFWTIGNLFRASKCFSNIKLNVWNVSNFVPIIKYLFPFWIMNCIPMLKWIWPFPCRRREERREGTHQNF